MNLQDLENLSNSTDRESLDTLSTKAASAELINEKTTEWNRIIHPVNYSTASNFARFGSAEKYYVDSISNIYNTFPYDGSKKERQEWRNNASDLDLYFIDNLYPKTSGYINLGKGVTYSSTNRISSTPQYVLFYGGPNQGSTFDKSNIFDSASNRTSNLSINFSRGNTVEFWFKDNAPSSSVSTNVFQGAYTLFECQNATNTAGIAIERRNLTNSFLITMTSGAAVAPNSLTVSIPNPNNWHHYAFSFIANSTNPANTDVKFYLDGILTSAFTSGFYDFSGLLDEKNMTGSIGFPVNGTTTKVASGSFDEFRFWKTQRAEQEIRDNMYNHIGGGANTDDENIGLGIYYKFNEGVVGDSSYDKTVLDYSGRISNGTIINYDSNIRNTGSAMETFNSKIVEPKDPIIYSNHSDVVSLYNTYQATGSEYDQTNANCLVNTIPSWILEAEQEEGRDELVNLFQIVSSYLDSLHIQTDHLSKVRYTEYTEGTYKPYPLYSKFLNSYDFNASELFKNASFSEYILNKNKDLNFEKSLDEIKNYIYRNIYNNLIYIYKTKGTIKSFRNLLRCYGIDESILKINIYSDSAEYKFENKTEEATLAKTFIDFNNSTRNSMTVFQTASFNDSDERGYISGSSADNFDLLPNTIEAEIVFPYKYDIYSPFFERSTIISSSLFGVHEANENANTLAWPAGDAFNFQVYAVRPEYNSKDVKFAVSSSAFGGIYLESQVFKNVYNDEKWNLAVRIKNNKDGLNDITGLDTTQNYLLELYGANTISGDVVNSFLLSSSLSNASVSAGLKRNKRAYVGAHRQDFIGSVLSYSDVKISSLRYWYNYLTNDEINRHAQDGSSYGVSDPAANAFFGINALRQYQIPNVDTLVLNWDFSTVTGSDSNGKFTVYDISSGSLNNYKYGNFSNTLFRKHSAVGTGSVLNSSDVINIEYLSIGKNKLPETVSGKELIQVLDSDVVRTNKDVKPTTYQIAFEKSMYQTLSEDMLKLFSSISDLNTIVGHPLNTIRNSYKDLDFLRRIYYNKISNTPSLEKYIEFYKWIDSSITAMLTDLVPAGAKITKTLSNVVESHILERNKVNLNKFTGLRANNKGQDRLFPVVSTNNLNYSDVKPPNSPAGQTWLAKRADRTKESLVSSGNSTVDQAREQLRKAIYYKNSVDTINSYDSSNNNIFEGNKDKFRLFSSIYSIKTATPDSQKLNKNSLIKTLYATSNNFKLFLNTNISSSNIDYSLSKQKVYATVSGTNIPLDARSDLSLPFTIYKDINTGVIYFTNTQQDLYGTNEEIGMQGPFTETHVGGNLHRHAFISQSTDRNELYSFDGVSGLSASSNLPLPLYRQERAKRPVNTRNIKNSPDGTRLGNYSNAYEVISINGRNNNNLDFVLSGGISVPTVSSQISLFKERNLNNRTSNKTVIVNKFSTPGAETSGRGANDLDAETFSVYNSINNRNLKVRKYLDKWTAQTWSVDSNAPSFRKVIKNTNYRQVSGSSGYSLTANYDNGFVRYQIPQSDLQYSWISASTTGSITTSGFIDSRRDNVSNLNKYVTFVTGLPGLDFSGLNTLITTSVNTSSNLISPINTSSADAINNYLLNLNGAYRHPSWKQIRNEQKTIVKLYRNNNIITAQDLDKGDNNRDITKGLSNTFSAYVEPPFEINYPVKQKIVDLSNNAIIDVVSEYDNVSSSFANDGLVSRISGSLTNKEYEYSKYKKLHTDAPDNFQLKEAEYSDRIFPRNENLGLIKIRSKPNYMEVVGTGSNGYDRNNAQIRSFWRSNIIDRTRSTKATSSSGYLEPSQVGFDNYIRAVTSSRTDVVFWNNSSSSYKNYLTVLTYSYNTKNTSSIFAQDAAAYTLTTNTSIVSSLSQSSITASNRIVGDLLAYTELETKFFVLNQTGTTTSDFYYLYNPSLPASASNVIVPKPQLFYMNAGAKFIYRNASGGSSSFITVNTGAQYTMTSSGKYPWFDSYQEYFEDIRPISSNMSYLAEYTFADVADYYIRQKNGNFKALLSSSYLFLDGIVTNINDSGSYTLPVLTTNKLNGFLLSDNNQLSGSKKISLKINGIKKLLPYKGFYPAERTVQLYQEFLRSWTGLSLNGDIINNRFRMHPLNTPEFYTTTADSNVAKNNFNIKAPSIDHQLLSLTQPLFNPGILFNSLKSSIAVDWPYQIINTLSQDQTNNYTINGYLTQSSLYTKSGSYALRVSSDVFSGPGNSGPLNSYVTVVSSDDLIEPVVGSNYDSRLSFESLLELDASNLQNYFNGGKGLAYLHPTYYSYSIFSSSLDRQRLVYPYYFLGNISGSINQRFNFKDNIYKLAMHNYISEIPSFFLKNGLTNFSSKIQKDGFFVNTGSVYSMDIVLTKKDAMNRDSSRYALRNHYGPPNSSLEEGYPVRYINIYMADYLSNYSMAPHSPPYYYGDSIVRLTFTPKDAPRVYTLKEIIDSCEKSIIGPNLYEVYLRNIYISGTDYTIYPGQEYEQYSNYFWDYLASNRLYNKSSIYIKNMMTLTSSVNIDILSSDKNIGFDENGYPLNISDDSSDNLNKWIIQTKWESPFISTSDSWDFWTKYGTKVQDGQGLSLTIKDSSAVSSGTSSLADLVGFEKTSKPIGSIAESKIISEAIVMIPYTSKKNHNGKLDTAQTLLPLLGENGVFSDRVGADPNNPSYFYVDKNKVNELIGLDISSEKLTLDQIKNRLTSTKLDQNNNIVKTMRSMMDYNLPPHLDWITNKTVDPFVMYIFEFKHKLDSEDLVDVWQGLMPKIAKTAELDSVTVEHNLSEYEFFHGKNLPDDIRWKVFKVKKRANTNYYKLTADSKDDARFKFQFAGGTKEPEYSYNWPYDYFSLVEMANIDASIKVSDEKPVDPTLVPFEKWLKPQWADIPKELLGEEQYSLKTGFAKNVGPQATEVDPMRVAKDLEMASVPTGFPGAAPTTPAGSAGSALGGALAGAVSSGAASMDKFAQTVLKSKQEKTNQTVQANQQEQIEAREKRTLMLKKERYDKVSNFLQKIWNNGNGQLAQYKEKLTAPGLNYQDPKLTGVIQKLLPYNLNIYKANYNIDISDFDWYSNWMKDKLTHKLSAEANIKTLTDAYAETRDKSNTLTYSAKYILRLPPELTQDELDKIKKYEDEDISNDQNIRQEANTLKAKKTKLSYK